MGLNLYYTVRLKIETSRTYLKAGAGAWCSQMPGNSRNTLSQGIRRPSQPLGALTVQPPSYVSLK